jgi:hypothetical protein
MVVDLPFVGLLFVGLLVLVLLRVVVYLISDLLRFSLVYGCSM